jgi:hypothetical protein
LSENHRFFEFFFFAGVANKNQKPKVAAGIFFFFGVGDQKKKLDFPRFWLQKLQEG